MQHYLDMKDMRSELLAEGFGLGREEGREEGIQEGIEKTIMIIRLLPSYNNEEIMTITNTSLATVTQLRKEFGS